MYLFYVVTTNISVCIFSFFADVLTYDISHGPCRLQIEAAGDGYLGEHLLILLEDGDIGVGIVALRFYRGEETGCAADDGYME